MPKILSNVESSAINDDFHGFLSAAPDVWEGDEIRSRRQQECLDTNTDDWIMDGDGDECGQSYLVWRMIQRVVHIWVHLQRVIDLDGGKAPPIVRRGGIPEGLPRWHWHYFRMRRKTGSWRGEWVLRCTSWRMWYLQVNLTQEIGLAAVNLDVA